MKKTIRSIFVLCLALVMTMGIASAALAKAPTQVMVIYNLNGGNYKVKVPATSANVVDGKVNVKLSSAIPETSKDDYAFYGWSFDKDAKKADFEAGETISFDATTSRVTLYAVWGPADKSVKAFYLCYHSNGGTKKPPMTAKYSVGYADFTISSKPALRASKNYVFSGWSLNADGTGTIYNAGDVITVTNAKTTLYAVWTRIA